MAKQENSNLITTQDAVDWENWIEQSQSGAPITIPKYESTVAKSKRIDLHGMTVNDAYNAVCEFIEQHMQCNTPNIVIVTGKSGQIRDEFIGWLGKIKAVVRYHAIVDTRGGVGSYRLYLNLTKK